MRVIHPKYSQTGNNFMVLKQQGRLVFDIAPPASSECAAGPQRRMHVQLRRCRCAFVVYRLYIRLPQSFPSSSLHFCSSAAGDGAGRAFDWKEKVGFSLSATELAQLAAAPFSGPVREGVDACIGACWRLPDAVWHGGVEGDCRCRCRVASPTELRRPPFPSRPLSPPTV